MAGTVAGLANVNHKPLAADHCCMPEPIAVPEPVALPPIIRPGHQEIGRRDVLALFGVQTKPAVRAIIAASVRFRASSLRQSVLTCSLMVTS